MFEIVEKKIWDEKERVEEVRKGEEGMGEGTAKEKEGHVSGASLLQTSDGEEKHELVRLVLDMKT
jgi:hypothetical protein